MPLRALRIALLTIGIAAILVGLLWIGQGLGVIRWPASSFMIAQREWAIRGALLGIVGVVLVVRSRRR